MRGDVWGGLFRCRGEEEVEIGEGRVDG